MTDFLPSLNDRVAVVTGASRGAGRGIAVALGDAGATVYVTGRTTRDRPNPEGLGGTVEETAEEVTARGGTGIAVACDHTADDQVDRVFHRVRDEQGRLDLLVNNVWGGYERGQPGFGPYWTEPLRQWDGMFVAGVRAHLVATRAALPLMVPPEALSPARAVSLCERCGLPIRAGEAHTPTDFPGMAYHDADCVAALRDIAPRGLIVNTIAWAGGAPLPGVFYAVSKAAIIQLIKSLAHELRPLGIAAIAVWPGWMRTERIMQAHAKRDFDLTHTESPEYVGRGIVHLAADPALMHRSGGVFAAGDLARDYGFNDVDGRQPVAFRLGGPDGWPQDTGAG